MSSWTQYLVWWWNTSCFAKDISSKATILKVGHGENIEYNFYISYELNKLAYEQLFTNIWEKESKEKMSDVL